MSISIAPTIDTIIWDLDGTLLDSFGIYRSGLNQTLRALGRQEINDQIYRNNYHGSIDESIAGALREAGQRYTAAELAEIVREFYILDNAYVKNVDAHLFNDAVALVERAHATGKRQIVATNRAHGTERGNASPRNMIANSRLHNKISDVLCGDDGTHRKPHRQFLSACFGADLTSLGNMLVIGDQAVDAAFAHNIGADAILVTRTNDVVAHFDQSEHGQHDVRVTSSLLTVIV